MIKTVSVNTVRCENENFLEIIKKSGFDGLDINFTGKINELLINGNYERYVYELKERIEKHGLSCTQVHMPYYDIFVSSEIYDDDIEMQIKNSFHVMKMLGAKWGAYHPMSSTNFGYDEKRAMKDNYERLKIYAEWANEQGVGVAVENIPVFPDCPQYNFFTSKYEQHCELVDSLKLENVKICWDFGHSNLMDYEIEKVIDYVGDRIKIVHIHNNYGVYDMHLCPAIGQIDWNKVIPVLKKHNFSGPLTIELNMDMIKDEYFEDYMLFCGKTADKLLKKF